MAARTIRRQHSFRMRYGLLAATALCAHPVAAETSIRPYVEGRTVFTSRDVTDLGAYRSWLEVSGGLQASFDSQRVDGTVDYRISRRLPLGSTVSDKVRHNGAGSIRTELIRDYFFLNAQGSASISSPTLGGLINPDSDDASDYQTFGGSVQPVFRHTFANRIRTEASYRYSVFEVQGGLPPLRIGDPFELNRPYFGGASDQRSQSATASIGNSRRSDRLRVELRGEWFQDRIEQLDEHYDSRRAVVDAELALTRFISVVGSGGYEDVRNEVDSVLADPLTGFPVLDAAGRLQLDPANPRRVNFDYEGPTWDAGIRLTPSVRTGLLVRLGERFGSFSGNGSLYYRSRTDLTFSAGYRDSINNFGRLYTTLFADPVSGFVIPVGARAGGGGIRGGIPLGAGSCAVGFDVETQFCRFNLSQIATSAVFRDRTANFSIQKGTPEFANDARFYASLSGFYTRRKYLGESDLAPPVQVPFVPALYLSGTTDTSYGALAQAQRLLGGNRYITFDLRAQRNEYALSRVSKDFFVSAYSRYEMLLDRRINLFATAFLSRRFADDADDLPIFLSRVAFRDRTQATFSIGVRYMFAPYRGKFTPAENERSRQ